LDEPSAGRTERLSRSKAEEEEAIREESSGDPAAVVRSAGKPARGTGGELRGSTGGVNAPSPPKSRRTRATKVTDLPPRAEAVDTPAWSKPQGMGAQGRSVMRSVGLDVAVHGLHGAVALVGPFRTV
jgi:hypothetical protein